MVDATINRAAPVLVFADDWGRHPSSCQHLVRQFLGRREAYWVNTIGMRSPQLNLASVSRAVEKLKHWVVRRSGGTQSLPPHLHVVNPLMWPCFGSRFSRRLNRWLLTRRLLPLVQSLPTPPIAVTTIPIVADLVGELPVQRWVYYCVDDFGEWPGLDQETLRRMEADLVARVDSVIAVSESLQAKLDGMGREAPLLTHGADLDFWQAPEDSPVPEVAHLERPLILFWGVLDRRMDLEFLRRLSADLTAGTIVLVGPSADPDPELSEIPRIVRTGVFAFERLPCLARAADVLIMPYADLPVTRAMQPLKLKEYLATGKPTVVRRLPATRQWGDCLDQADTPESFSAAVRQRLREGLPGEQVRARGRLLRESWAEKVRQFEQWALTA
jgi:glycosyltransferase involved in cell wall biosynthesis